MRSLEQIYLTTYDHYLPEGKNLAHTYALENVRQAVLGDVLKKIWLRGDATVDPVLKDELKVIADELSEGIPYLTQEVLGKDI